MELWKNIDEDYEVSSEGRIKSKPRLSTQLYNGETRTHRLKGKILAQQPSPPRGYLRVKLHNRYVSVSHLVATAFIPNPNGYTVVHHKDHNPNNNCVENLEWINGDTHIKLHSSEQSQTVYQYTIEGKLVAIYSSAMEAARHTGFNQGHISECCRDERKTHKGYIWSLKPLI